MTSINSDFMSQLALRSLGNSSNMMTQAMERLSTGKRVNSAADDAAGLGIATKLRAQVNSLNAATRNATDALALIGTIDGALEESGEILLRMRELAVQSASDTNTGTDRSFIQDEINALNNELNRISSSTEFNAVKLLDGTYNNKQIQIGTGANQVFNIGVTATDSSTLGAYELESTAEITASSGTANAAAAKTALTALLNDAADYTVKGSFGEATVKVDAGADARDVAKSFNLSAGTTGINATAITKAQITKLSHATTVSFTLQGKSTTASTVTGTITSTTDLTALKDSINSVSGSTGIIATLTSDKAGINVTNDEGYDIFFGDLDTGGVDANLVINAMERDGTLDGTSRTLDGDATNGDSAGIIGQVILSGDKPFTVTPGDAANHFSTGTASISSSLSTVGSISIKTVSGATNAIAVLDGALSMISASRSKMGALQNRLNATVDNLSTIITKTEQARSRVLDADMASETTALSKSQILQQASTAMLAQANQANQGVLQLLQA